MVRLTYAVDKMGLSGTNPLSVYMQEGHLYSRNQMLSHFIIIIYMLTEFLCHYDYLIHYDTMPFLEALQLKQTNLPWHRLWLWMDHQGIY